MQAAMMRKPTKQTNMILFHIRERNLREKGLLLVRAIPTYKSVEEMATSKENSPFIFLANFLYYLCFLLALNPIPMTKVPAKDISTLVNSCIVFGYIMFRAIPTSDAHDDRIDKGMSISTVVKYL